MSEVILVFKVIFLLMAIAYSYSNTLRATHEESVGAPQIMMMSIGITGFITLQWLI